MADRWGAKTGDSPASAVAHRGAPELAIVVPTRNERANVRELVNRLDHALRGIDWQLIVVDDNSPDGTAKVVRALTRKNHRVKCIRRVDKRGLSSACIEGFFASRSEYLAIMDADLQHDERILPEMLAELRTRKIDVVVGSRYTVGARVIRWQWRRLILSRFAIALSRMVSPAGMTDPMSGFFMVRREAFADAVAHMSGRGFKIMLDLFASSPRRLAFCEIPYHFRQRHAGVSKLSCGVLWDNLVMLLRMYCALMIQPRTALQRPDCT